MEHKKTDWLRYVIVFIITLLLFGTASFVSSYFNNRKLAQIKNIQDKIFLDILSSETQFNLLQQSSCQDVNRSVLSQELNSLSEKINYSEKNIDVSKEELDNLRRYYSLLEIKDYILMQQISKRCNMKSIFVLYFYQNDDCPDCVKQWYSLGILREKYPELRVYSFDYNIDMSAVKALISMYKVPNKMPALVMNGKVYTGYKSVEDVEKSLPELIEEAKKQERERALNNTKNATSTE